MFLPKSLTRKTNPVKHKAKEKSSIITLLTGARNKEDVKFYEDTEGYSRYDLGEYADHTTSELTIQRKASKTAFDSLVTLQSPKATSVSLRTNHASKTSGRLLASSKPPTKLSTKVSGSKIKQVTMKPKASGKATTSPTLLHVSKKAEGPPLPRKPLNRNKTVSAAPGGFTQSRSTIRTRSPAEKKKEEALSAFVAELRRKAAAAYEHSKERWSSSSDQLRQHFMWLGLLAPFAILCAYFIFVIVSRNSKPQPGDSERSFRAPAHPNTRLSIAELKRRNWIRRRRPIAQCYDEFDKKDFRQAGPLILTKELKGEVKFAESTESGVISKVQYDKDLNEMVNIGTKVEVVPSTEAMTAVSLTDKAKKASTASNENMKASPRQAAGQPGEHESDKETQRGEESELKILKTSKGTRSRSKMDLTTGMRTAPTPLEEKTGEVENKEKKATLSFGMRAKSFLELRSRKSGAIRQTMRARPSSNTHLNLSEDGQKHATGHR